ncbi:kinase-like domain-containing protein, partial [Hysterangium stoloniferum]
YDGLNRRLIIKAISPYQNASEIDIITYLNFPRLRSSPHNHTIPLIEQFRLGGWHFMVMPLWNMTFAPYLVWQVDDYFRRSIQCLEGLDFMHDHGIAHRNICIRNIVYNQDGTQETAPLGCRLQPIISKWKVQLAYIDFGISRKFLASSDPTSWVVCESTEPNPFTAPEVVKAMQGEIEYRALPADVYSLGRVWQYAINDHSRERTYALEMLQQKAPQYMDLINAMLHEDPEERPTAKEALLTLKHIRRKLPGKVRFSPPGGYAAVS